MGIFRSGSKLKTPQVTQNWVISAVFVQNVWGSQCWPKVKCVRLHPRKIHLWDFMIPHSSSRETRSYVVLDSARKYDTDILWFCHDSKQQLYRYKKNTSIFGMWWQAAMAAMMRLMCKWIIKSYWVLFQYLSITTLQQNCGAATWRSSWAMNIHEISQNVIYPN